MKIRRPLGLLLMALLSAKCAWAQPQEYAVKAAFIYNFAKFVKWPESTSKITLCIIGNNPFGAATDSLDGKFVEGRIFRVNLTGSLNSGCNIVFVSESERNRLPVIIESIKSAGVLTVADSEGFARNGVMINFFIDESGRVRFEINNEAIRKGGLIIGSQLLKLGKAVGSGEARQ